MVEAIATDVATMSTLVDVYGMQKRIVRSTYQKRLLKSRLPDKSILERMADILPSRETCDSLVQEYFKTWEKAFRVLHTTTFLRDLERFWIARRSADAVTDSSMLPLLTAVIATAQASIVPPGSSSSEDHSNAGGATSADRCDLLHEWSTTVPRKQRLELSTLQTLTLLVLTELALFTPNDTIWSFMGSVNRMAMTMGLQCDVSSSPKLPVADKETRKRLWFTIVELDLQLSMANGMPPTIYVSQDELDPPLNVNDDELSMESPDLPDVPPHYSNKTDVTAQMLLVKSLPVRLAAARTSIPGARDENAANMRIIELEGFPISFPPQEFAPASIQDRDTCVRKHLLYLDAGPALADALAFRTESPQESFIKDAVLRLAVEEHGGPGWTPQQYISLFRNDLTYAILSLCQRIKDSQSRSGELLRIAKDGVNSLTGTIGVLGGDLKQVLCIAAILHFASHDSPDAESMRQDLTKAVEDARRVLESQSNVPEPAEVNQAAATGSTEDDLIDSFMAQSEFGTMSSETWSSSGFLEADFDLDWATSAF